MSAPWTPELDAQILRHMPVWAFHERERYFPVDMEAYLRQCVLVDPATRTVVQTPPLSSAVVDALPAAQHHMDLAILGGTTNPIVAGKLADARPYVHVVRLGSKTYIQYVVFCAYNGPTAVLRGALWMGAHQADLENVTAVLDTQTGACTGYYLSHHGDETLVEPGDMLHDGARVIVYSAEGSHAHYSRVGAHKRLRGCAYDQTSSMGVRWRPQNYQFLVNPGEPGYDPTTMGFLRLEGCMGDGLTGGSVDALPLKPWWLNGVAENAEEPADLTDTRLYAAGKAYMDAHQLKS